MIALIAALAGACRQIELGFAERDDLQDPHNRRVRPMPLPEREQNRPSALLAIAVRTIPLRAGDARLATLLELRDPAARDPRRSPDVLAWIRNGVIPIPIDPARQGELGRLAVDPPRSWPVREGEPCTVPILKHLSGSRPLTLYTGEEPIVREEEPAGTGLQLQAFRTGPGGIELVIVPVLLLPAEGGPQPVALEDLRAQVFLRRGQPLLLVPADGPPESLGAFLLVDGDEARVVWISVDGL